MQTYHNAKEQAQIAQMETFLKDFGFNNREISVYLALGKIKKASPSELGKLTSVERSDVYRILDSLVDKGFVIKIVEKPIQYAIAPPEKAFRRTIDEKRRNLSTLESQVESSNRILSELLSKSDLSADESKFEVIKSRTYVFERIAEMLSSERCKQEVLYYGTEKCAGRILFHLKEVIAQLNKRQIDLKIMLPITPQNQADVKALSKYSDIRDLPHERSRAIIVDRKESMMMYTASDDDNYSDDLALWLNNAQFSEMSADMFDAQWKLAKDLHTKVKELEKPVISSYSEENPDLVLTIDQRGKVTFLSHNVDAYLAKAIPEYIAGLQRGEMTKFSFPDDQVKIDAIWRTGKSGVIGKDEFRTLQENGETRWWSLSWLPLVGKKGDTETIRVVLKDITNAKKLELVEKELKTAQEALVESESRFRLQFEQATDAIFLADIATGLIIDCNNAATILTGYDKEELVGKSQSFIHPNQGVHQSFSYHTKCPDESVSIQVLTKSGELRDVVIKATVIEFKSRRIMQGIFRDVTEERKSQEVIRQTKLNYETFFDTIDEFLYVLDEQGNILQVNNTVISRLGYAREELLNHSVLMVHPQELRNEAAKIVQEMLEGKVAYCPIPVQTKDGKLIPVETRVTRGQWNGEPVLFGVSKDVSKLKLSEAKFSQAFNSSAVLMALSNEKTGKFLDVNETFMSTLGFTRQEIVGKTANDLRIFEVPQERNKAIQLLHENGKVRNLEVKIRTKTGGIKRGLFSVDYIKVAEEPILLTTMVDLTDR